MGKQFDCAPVLGDFRTGTKPSRRLFGAFVLVRNRPDVFLELSY
jgi:hypothetical protein